MNGERSHSLDTELAAAPALSQGFGGDGEAIVWHTPLCYDDLMSFSTRTRVMGDRAAKSNGRGSLPTLRGFTEETANTQMRQIKSLRGADICVHFSRHKRRVRMTRVDQIEEWPWALMGGWPRMSIASAVIRGSLITGAGKTFLRIMLFPFFFQLTFRLSCKSNIER